jgi:hypothetical protein
MRSPQDDIAVIGEAGFFRDENDPLLTSIIVLLMYGKRRHKPVLNLHKLANAIERGDMLEATKHYQRLGAEVLTTLEKYPDLAAQAHVMANLSDEERAFIDRAMSESLGAELYARSPDAYRRRAEQIVSDRSGRPQLSDSVKEIVFRTFVPLLEYLDPDRATPTEATPFGLALTRIYGEAVAGAYALAASEDWSVLNAHEASQRIDDALSARPGGSPETPAGRATLILAGVLGQLEEYQPISDLIECQPAYHRVNACVETYVLLPDDQPVQAILAHPGGTEKYRDAVTFAWRSGITVAALERLGQI